MAYAALVSLEQTIHQILNQERYSTSAQEKRHIASLGTNVSSFQDFLENFPKEAKHLEARIRDAATAAEDVIEVFMLDQIRGCCGCIMWINALTGIKFEYKLNKVAEKMEAIAAEVVEIKNSVTIKGEKLDKFSIGSSSTVLPVGKMDVVGFDDDLLEIKGRLAGQSLQLQYLAISGMGGIGKTTLARNAYDDQLIQEHFHIRAWVTISQDYRAEEILSCLLDSMKEFNPKGSKGSVAELAERIYKILYQRRYLIVMDDTWSTEVLDDVRKLFPDDCNGSRIMLTTRISDVAAYAKNSSPHQMRLMDENKSWDLLKHKISRDILPDELETIGHEIVRSCRGLPLAVVVIAGILSSISETPASWEEVAKNIKKATSKDNRMEEIVSLGYNHLPHHLRACLLYMGLLPEDYSIRVSLLVKLWMAEGFLKHPDDSSKSVEANAEEYLEDLVRRNLIMANERKYNGKIKSCSLHDLVRDTCVRMLAEENHLRHVTTNYNQVDDQCDISKRSVIRIGSQGGRFDHYRLLRVLHVPDYLYDSRALSSYHLRHLSFVYYRPLPADLSRFQNLQSLIITESLKGPFIELPSSIWKLRHLRHLLIYRGCFPARYCKLRSAPVLENLQTLSGLVYDEKDEAYLLLQRFPNLIKLGLILLPEVNYAEDLLVCLHQLEKLRIWCIDPERHFSAVIPGWLKKFTLRDGRVSISFLEAVGSLPNLEVLKLIRCVFENATWEVRDGEFPKLKKLQLTELKEITTFNVEDSSTSLQMLNFLLISRCYHLVELSDEIGGIPALQMIEVSHSGIGVCDWARRVEEERESFENETLQVRCVHPEPGMLPRKPWET